MIIINVDKAKLIAHDLRREARATEFAPYDEIIAKRLPGTAEQEAELQRQTIRQKYADMQVAIDSVNTIDELKAVILQK